MIGQPQRHRWSSVVIPTHAIGQREPQGPMGSIQHPVHPFYNRDTDGACGISSEFRPGGIFETSNNPRNGLDFTGTDRSALMAWLSRAEHSLGYAKFASNGWRARAYTALC